MVMIFALVGVVALGVGFYYVKIYTPKKELEAAQGEVNGWEARYQEARACLLGKSPLSAKTSEALAIREMAPDPWDRGRCTPLVSKLSRGVGNESGIDAVEKAWETVDKAAQKAALAFATHVGSSTTVLQDPLPAALDALDIARVQLRTAAKLPAAAVTGATLPAAQIVAITDGNEPVVDFEFNAVPSTHGIVLFGKTASREVQAVLKAGEAPTVMRVAPGAVRAVPDGSWGVSIVGNEVRIGAFDAEGALTTPIAGKPLKESTAVAALGTRDQGIAVSGSFAELAVTRVAGDKLTHDPVVKMQAGVANIDVDGRVSAVWRVNDASFFGRILKPGADEPAVAIPPAPILMSCLTRDRAWTQDLELAIGFGGGKPVITKPLEGAKLQGCTDEVAVFRRFGEPRAHVICSDDCRNAGTPVGAPETATTTVVSGKLVATAAHGGVLAVWHEGGTPTFYSLAEPVSPAKALEWPAMAMTNGKVIDVLGLGAKGYVLIRIPAS
jgi:hypothetical protein